MHSLDTLEPIFATLSSHAGGRPFRLGLATIGMRTNPYGSAVADNPGNVRIAMASADPRQRGLFGAAWMVGVAAATVGWPVEFVALGSAYGPFGLAADVGGWTAPGTREWLGAVFPVFHTYAGLRALSGRPRLVLELPAGLRGVAASGTSGPEAVIANCTAEPIHIPAAMGGSSWLILDTRAAPVAARHPRWLTTQPRGPAPETLPPYAVAFVRWRDS
jgi:hypothetical protein